MNNKNSFTKILLLILTFSILMPVVYAGFFGDLGGALFGGIGNAVGNFVDGAVGLVIGVLSGIGQVVVDTVGGAVGAIGGVISGGETPGPSVPGVGGGVPSGFNRLTPGTGGVPGGVPVNNGESGQDVPVYYRETSRVSNIRELGFSRIELANIHIETFLQNNEVFSGMEVLLYSELQNVGTQNGFTKIRTEVNCVTRNLVGNVVSPLETEIRSSWLITPEIKSGRVGEQLTIWEKTPAKFDNGGQCIVTTELSENVRRTTAIESIVCTIFALLSGDIKEDCSTTTGEPQETVKTEGDIKRELTFDIQPRIPELLGGVDTDLFTNE